MGSCELNGPPNRSLRAENRPEHFSRARGRSAASLRTHPVSAFPARADSADETCVLVALLKPKLCLVRMNPFILCPWGPNGSSAAQIELERANLELAEKSMRSVKCELLAMMAANDAGVSAEESGIFGIVSRVPGER